MKEYLNFLSAHFFTNLKRSSVEQYPVVRYLFKGPFPLRTLIAKDSYHDVPFVDSGGHTIITLI